MVPDDKSVGKRLADDAMYKLEHESDDRGKSKDFAPRLVEISDIQVKQVILSSFNGFLFYSIAYSHNTHLLSNGTPGYSMDIQAGGFTNFDPFHSSILL